MRSVTYRPYGRSPRSVRCSSTVVWMPEVCTSEVYARSPKRALVLEYQTSHPPPVPSSLVPPTTVRGACGGGCGGNGGGGGGGEGDGGGGEGGG